MYHLKWDDDEYGVGIKEIDDQHKKLIELIRRLLKSICYNKGDNRTVKVIDELIEYADVHFSLEEKYFRKFNYEFAKEHVKEHSRFREKMVELRESCSRDRSGTIFEAVNYLGHWFANHLNDSDRKYIKCFTENGLK